MPDRTASSVALLEQAGYANVGKTNLHEFAYGITSENPHYGTVPNPLAPDRIAGGSSGGSAAALAAGLADAALGTDSGGSIRIPAACCGVVGFKPTFDLVPVDGCFPLAPSFDHVGPLARSVEECERMMEVLVPGYEGRDLDTLDDVRVRTLWLEEADPLVRACVSAAAARFQYATPAELPGAWETQPLFMHEVADVHRELYAENAELYGADLASKIERCLDVGDAEAATARVARERYRERIAGMLEDVDLLLTPTLTCVAPRTGIGDLELRKTLIRCTYPFNVTGLPALALPCGPAEDGLPASVQLVGAPGCDALVLAAGRALASLLRVTPDTG